MSPSPDTKLVRVIGRWSLTALMINAIIGSGIFGLSSIVTHSIGRLGPWAYLVAAGTQHPVAAGGIKSCQEFNALQKMGMDAAVGMALYKKTSRAIAADSVFSVSLSYIGPENAFVMRS